MSIRTTLKIGEVKVNLQVTSDELSNWSWAHVEWKDLNDLLSKKYAKRIVWLAEAKSEGLYFIRKKKEWKI